MRTLARWLVPALFVLTSAATVSAADSDCSALKGCEAKQCEIQVLIERARKEGNMRRLSTLKDLRSEQGRCKDSPAG